MNSDIDNVMKLINADVLANDVHNSLCHIINTVQERKPWTYGDLIAGLEKWYEDHTGRELVYFDLIAGLEKWYEDHTGRELVYFDFDNFQPEMIILNTHWLTIEYGKPLAPVTYNEFYRCLRNANATSIGKRVTDITDIHVGNNGTRICGISEYQYHCRILTMVIE